MSEPTVRRFPFWLTLSVLGNLVLIGLLAGIFLNAPPSPDRRHASGSARPDVEMSREDREVVRQLMRASFESGREAIETRRAAERRFVEVLGTEPYDEAAARAALASLREADRIARDTVANTMFAGLDDLTPDQRALVAKFVAGNIDKRDKAGERLEKFRDRREERRRKGLEQDSP